MLTLAEIAADWLNEPVDRTPAQILAAFTRVEAQLGRECMELVRGESGGDEIVRIGELLTVTEGLVNGGVLLEKLRAGKPEPLAELAALAILGAGEHGMTAEVDPVFSVAGTDYAPDARIRQGDSSWVGIEVSQPEQARLAHGITTISGIVERKARQLPPQLSNLVLIEHLETGAEWVVDAESALAAHPHVSGVCAFATQPATGDRGRTWITSHYLVEHNAPNVRLPAWLRERLA